MAKAATQETLLAREAIKEILKAATEPMSAGAIADQAIWRDLGLQPVRASYHLATLYNTKKKPFPLSRIYGRKGFEYFNPDVVKLEIPEERRAEPRREDDKLTAGAALGAKNLGDFTFNPMEFASEERVPGNVDVPVAIPPGIKTITLNIGAVAIRIDLA